MNRVTASTIEDGVLLRRLELHVGGDAVATLLLTPEGAKGHRPLILHGHGGGSDKHGGAEANILRSIVRDLGYAVVSTDLPGYGERLPPGEGPVVDRIGEVIQADTLERARIVADPNGWVKKHARAMSSVGREWSTTLDVVQGLDDVGTGPVGFFGASIGTQLGIHWIPREPRVRAAVLAIAGYVPDGTTDDPWVTRAQQDAAGEGLDLAARQVNVPVLFIVQLDDTLISRGASLALFDLLGSSAKTMHANPGDHIPLAEIETSAIKAFFADTLGPQAPLPAR